MKPHLLLALALAPCAIAAPPTPAAPFGDSMVLQRDMKVPVWGHADANSKITVSFAGQTKSTQADATGAWRVELDPMRAEDSGRVMTMASGSEKTELKDILVGEVWICSGQSNMEFPVAKSPMQTDALKTTDDGLRIRLIKKRPSAAPLTDLAGSSVWLHATPQSTPHFSAVAVAFGQELRRKLKVPVGLVGAYWGGTRIEAWIPADAKPGDLPPTVAVPQFNAPHQVPSVLYNGMVHPWVGYSMRGMIWYQGESNCMQQDGPKYTERMKSLVSTWRKAWGREDFPVNFVQIAPFSYAGAGTDTDPLPAFWEAQVAAAREIPHAAMAHIADVGNWRDIHPVDKQPVGERLARLALSRTYGVKFPDDTGPEFKDMRIAGNKVSVAFDHAASGLRARDGKPLAAFEIAGADGKWEPAEANIRGALVVVSSKLVPQPTQIRLGMKPGEMINLVNREDLPAAPFRAIGK